MVFFSIGLLIFSTKCKTASKNLPLFFDIFDFTDKSKIKIKEKLKELRDDLESTKHWFSISNQPSSMFYLAKTYYFLHLVGHNGALNVSNAYFFKSHKNKDRKSCYSLGKRYFFSNKKEKAHEYFLEGEKLGCFKCKVFLCKMMINNENKEEIKSSLEACLKSKSVVAALELGKLFIQEKDFKKAIEYFEVANTFLKIIKFKKKSSSLDVDKIFEIFINEDSKKNYSNENLDEKNIDQSKAVKENIRLSDFILTNNLIYKNQILVFRAFCYFKQEDYEKTFILLSKVSFPKVITEPKIFFKVSNFLSGTKFEYSFSYLRKFNLISRSFDSYNYMLGTIFQNGYFVAKNSLKASFYTSCIRRKSFRSSITLIRASNDLKIKERYHREIESLSLNAKEGDERAISMLGEVYEKEGKFKQAVSLYEQANKMGVLELVKKASNDRKKLSFGGKNEISELENLKSQSRDVDKDFDMDEVVNYDDLSTVNETEMIYDIFYK